MELNSGNNVTVITDTDVDVIICMCYGSVIALGMSGGYVTEC